MYYAPNGSKTGKNDFDPIRVIYIFFKCSVVDLTLAWSNIEHP